MLPPSFDRDGAPLTEVNYGELRFSTAEARDIAFVAQNTKLQFLYWCMRGDDLNVPQWVYADFPLDIGKLPKLVRDRLLECVDGLEDAMQSAVSFKLNAGKKVGNYNLALCRAVTDRADEVLYRVMGLEEVRDDVELLYSQMVRTAFEVEENGEQEWWLKNAAQSPSSAPPAAPATSSWRRWIWPRPCGTAASRS
jgi:hypothetical protein